MLEYNKKFNSIKILISKILDDKNKKPRKKKESEIFQLKKTKVKKNKY